MLTSGTIFMRFKKRVIKSLLHLRIVAQARCYNTNKLIDSRILILDSFKLLKGSGGYPFCSPHYGQLESR